MLNFDHYCSFEIKLAPQQWTDINVSSFLHFHLSSPQVEELLSKASLPLCHLLLLQFDLVKSGEEDENGQKKRRRKSSTCWKAEKKIKIGRKKEEEKVWPAERRRRWRRRDSEAAPTPPPSCCHSAHVVGGCQSSWKRLKNINCWTLTFSSPWPSLSGPLLPAPFWTDFLLTHLKVNISSQPHFWTSLPQQAR